jgi:hypothetical protein
MSARHAASMSCIEIGAGIITSQEAELPAGGHERLSGFSGSVAMILGANIMQLLKALSSTRALQ